MLVTVGDEGELLGLSPTELEMLSTPPAETNNHGQENMDGAQEDLLPDDVENLSQYGEDTPVPEDCSPSDSEIEQEPAVSHYPVRNRRPPHIVCYDHLGNPSYHPIGPLEYSSDNCQCLCLFTMVARYTLWNLSFAQSLDDT